MESRTKYVLALVALTLLVLAVRLAVSFQVAQPSYQSYYALVQARAITRAGLPLYHDPYSYEGRTHSLSPLFYYLVALFTTFLSPVLVAKLLPNLLMASLIPLVYLVSHDITKNRGVSLVAAFLAGFSPALFTAANDATTLSLGFPLVAAALLGLLGLEEHPVRSLILTALLTLVSPLIWLLLAAELVYLLILAGERMRIPPPHLEVVLFTFLLATWYALITYKEAFERYGFSVLSQSLPASVRQATFSQFTFLSMIYAVGVIPLAIGSLALYHSAFEERNKKVFLVASLGLVTLLAASLQLLPLPVALSLLSIVFVILAAPGLHLLTTYLRKTRFESLRTPLVILILFLFLLTSLLPAVVAGLYPGISPSRNELEATDWLHNSTANGSVVLAVPKTGFLLNYEAQRRYVADEDYLLITNPDAILADIDAAYTTPSSVAAVELMNKYGITYVYLGSQEQARYSELGAIIKDRTCFPILHQNPEVLIFGVNCTLTEGKP